MAFFISKEGLQVLRRHGITPYNNFIHRTLILAFLLLFCSKIDLILEFKKQLALSSFFETSFSAQALVEKISLFLTLLKKELFQIVGMLFASWFICWALQTGLQFNFNILANKNNKSSLLNRTLEMLVVLPLVLLLGSFWLIPELKNSISYFTNYLGNDSIDISLVLSWVSDVARQMMYLCFFVFFVAVLFSWLVFGFKYRDYSEESSDDRINRVSF